MVRTAKTEERVEARLRPELLDPSFEGYKLSLDPLATFQVSKKLKLPFKYNTTYV